MADTTAVASAALPFTAGAPVIVPDAIVFLAGAAPAACPGGVRVLLTRTVPEQAVSRALSAEASLTQFIWAAAPAAVVTLALQVDPGAPLLLGAVLAAAGVFQSGVMVTRSLSLRARLPEHVHGAAYSVMYAVQGVGYSITALLSALILEYADPAMAVLSGVAVALLITVVSAAAERRQEL